MGRRGGGLDDRAAGGERAAQHADPGRGQQRALSRCDDLPVPDARVFQVIHERPARDRERGGVEQVPHFAHHRQESPRPEQVVHEVAAGRLQVHQQRHVRSDPVEVVDGEVDAEPSGDGQQVHHRVRGPADGGERDDRVVEARPRQECGRTHVVRNQPHRQAPRLVRGLEQPRIGSRSARHTGDDRAQRLCDQRHRGGGAHRVAVTLAADHRRLAREEHRLAERPGAHLLGQSPYVRAASEGFIAEMTGEHRSAWHDHGGKVDGCRRHQQRRNGLVAAAEQHDAVDGVGAEHLLRRHRRHVAPEHRGGTDLRLPQRYDRQLQRNSAGFVDAVLHGLGDFREVGVARRQIGCGVGDRDLRAAAERIVGHATAHPGTVDVGVAVIPAVPLRTAKGGHDLPTYGNRMFITSVVASVGRGRRASCSSPATGGSTSSG